MKKSVNIILSIFLISSIFLTNPKNSYATNTVNITFDDGTKKIIKKYKKNTTISLNYMPKSPFKDNKYHWFSGWYTDKKLTNYAYDVKLKKNRTFYGKWYTLNAPKIAISYSKDRHPIIKTKKDNKYIRELTIYRATSKNGIYKQVAYNKTSFTDRAVKKNGNKTYYYMVSSAVFTGLEWKYANSKILKVK